MNTTHCITSLCFTLAAVDADRFSDYLTMQQPLPSGDADLEHIRQLTETIMFDFLVDGAALFSVARSRSLPQCTRSRLTMRRQTTIGYARMGIGKYRRTQFCSGTRASASIMVMRGISSASSPTNASLTPQHRTTRARGRFVLGSSLRS